MRRRRRRIQKILSSWSSSEQGPPRTTKGGGHRLLPVLSHRWREMLKKNYLSLIITKLSNNKKQEVTQEHKRSRSPSPIICEEALLYKTM